MTEQAIQTEDVELLTGPLCGLHLKVVAGQPAVRIGKREAGTMIDPTTEASVWTPYTPDVKPDTYVRTDRKTARSKRIYQYAPP